MFEFCFRIVNSGKVKVKVKFNFILKKLAIETIRCYYEIYRLCEKIV